VAVALAAVACLVGITLHTSSPNATATPAAAATAPMRPATQAGVLSFAGARAEAGAHASTKAADGERIEHPLLPSECHTKYGDYCYGPEQLRHLYGVDKLGPNAGAGRTVALIMPGLDPVFEHDLQVYSKEAGLPTPKVTTMKVGNPKVLDENDFVQAITAEELELDAQMIHTMAPGARILYAATEKDGANVLSGFGLTTALIKKLAKRGIGVVSLSFGFFEDNYVEAYGPVKAAQIIREQNAALAAAARHHMTIVSANGDTGVTGPNLAGDALYDHQTAAFISTSPYVTAVAGTELHADDHGNRTSPDTVWGDRGDMWATGGALSRFFARPGYQNPMRDQVGEHRGNVDAAMDGSLGSRVWMYTSKYQVLGGQQPGWVRTAGTSAASPLFAGIVADAGQRAGRALGPINAALYTMARMPAAMSGVADVTTGCNTTTAMPGYCARPGSDVPSGIGTVGKAKPFVATLARLALAA
jgi:subtilase family serine protease